MASALKTSILVVDDDPQIIRLLRAYLEQANFQVLTAADLQTAKMFLRAERPKLMILDVMLPDGDGFSFTAALRKDVSFASLPILILTARVDDVDKIVGLELGADDYITKPFNPREVVARVRRVLSRFNNEAAEAASILDYFGLRMDLLRRNVSVDGTPVELTPMEFDILRVMMENPGLVFTRSSLIQRTLGYDYGSLERSLDSHIKNLRKKIEPDPRQPTYIQTVHSIGYRLEKKP